jgi:hypothetical protein
LRFCAGLSAAAQGTFAGESILLNHAGVSLRLKQPDAAHHRNPTVHRQDLNEFQTPQAQSSDLRFPVVR